MAGADSAVSALLFENISLAPVSRVELDDAPTHCCAIMDRLMQFRHLEEAERHVAEGQGHIAEQEERIADLVREGHDTTRARKLLDDFYATQMMHIQHRDRIRKELEW
jgi:histone deacetylase complex regulatory component SIN3